MKRRSMLLGSLAGFAASLLPQPKKARAETLPADDPNAYFNTKYIPIRRELTEDLFIFEAGYAFLMLDSDATRYVNKHPESVRIWVTEPSVVPSIGEMLDGIDFLMPTQQFMADPIPPLRAFHKKHVAPLLEDPRYLTIIVSSLYTSEAAPAKLGFRPGYWRKGLLKSL